MDSESSTPRDEDFKKMMDLISTKILPSKLMALLTVLVILIPFVISELLDYTSLATVTITACSFEANGNFSLQVISS